MLKIEKLSGERATWQPPHLVKNMIEKGKEEDPRECLACSENLQNDYDSSRNSTHFRVFLLSFVY